MTICFLFWCNSLNVWKNSSCVCSLFWINWMSSISNTSMFLYFSLKASGSLLRIDLMKSFVNFSLEVYSTLAFGWLLRTWWPIACIRCVLPRPTPPYINRGLYACAGASATARLLCVWKSIARSNDESIKCIVSIESICAFMTIFNDLTLRFAWRVRFTTCLIKFS